MAAPLIKVNMWRFLFHREEFQIIAHFIKKTPLNQVSDLGWADATHVLKPSDSSAQEQQ